MKKIILSVFAVLAMASCFTSCSNTGTGCYWYTLEISKNSEILYKEEGYKYTTDEELQAYRQSKMDEYLGTMTGDVTGLTSDISYLKTNKSESDCQ